MQKFYVWIAGSFFLLCATNLLVLSIFSSKSVDGGAWPFIFGVHVLLNIAYAGSMAFVTKSKKNSAILICMSTVTTCAFIFCLETYALLEFSVVRDMVNACNPCRLFIDSGASIYVVYAIFPAGIFLFNTFRSHATNDEAK